MKTIEVDGSIENGWAAIDFKSFGKEFNLTFSYVVSDGLENLLNALVLLNKGIKETECSLMDEPGEHLLHFSTKQDSLIVTSYFSEKWTGRPLNEILREVKKEFEFECSLKQFNKQITLLFTDWEKEYTKEGYKMRWRNSYPEIAIEKLKGFAKK
jgi:hypothetical protein